MEEEAGVSALDLEAEVRSLRRVVEAFVEYVV